MIKYNYLEMIKYIYIYILQMDRINSLISKINSLDLSMEQNVEIYKIIKKENIKIMKNNNGAFVNLSSVSEQILKELENLVYYIDKNELIQNK